MRTLILEKIEEIRKQQNNFAGTLWINFMVGYFHISEVPMKGIPDGFLLSIYSQMLVRIELCDLRDELALKFDVIKNINALASESDNSAVTAKKIVTNAINKRLI